MKAGASADVAVALVAAAPARAAQQGSGAPGARPDFGGSATASFDSVLTDVRGAGNAAIDVNAAAVGPAAEPTSGGTADASPIPAAGLAAVPTLEAATPASGPTPDFRATDFRATDFRAVEFRAAARGDLPATVDHVTDGGSVSSAAEPHRSPETGGDTDGTSSALASDDLPLGSAQPAADHGDPAQIVPPQNASVQVVLASQQGPPTRAAAPTSARRDGLPAVAQASPATDVPAAVRAGVAPALGEGAAPTSAPAAPALQPASTVHPGMPAASGAVGSAAGSAIAAAGEAPAAGAGSPTVGLTTAVQTAPTAAPARAQAPTGWATAPTPTERSPAAGDSTPATPRAASGPDGNVAAAAQPPSAAAVVPQTAAHAAPQPAPPAAAGLQPQLAKPLFTLVGVAHGQHIMTLKVTPEDLGPLTVRAHIGAAGVRIELFAPGDVGREAVRAILPELRKELSDAGFGASLDLSEQGGPGGAGQSGGNNGAGQNGQERFSNGTYGTGRDPGGNGSGPGSRNGPPEPRPGHRWDALADDEAIRTARVLNGHQTNLDILV